VRSSVVLGLGSLLNLLLLLWLDVAAFRELLSRVLPVLGFVAAMSVVVNAAESLGTFGSVLGRVQQVLGIGAGRSRGDQIRAWLLIVVACLLVTIFFSLDTTAILLTPLAIKIARHTGLNLLSAAFAVVWTANLGSMLLPISNLTNLLAVQTTFFTGLGDYVALSWLPSVILILLAAIAPLFIRGTLRSHEVPDTPMPGALGPRTRIFVLLIAVLLVLLLTPLEFWIPTTAAALVAVVLLSRWNPAALSLGMIPWNSLFFALGLTTIAAIIHHLGLLDQLISWIAGFGTDGQGLFVLGFSGALLANLINNIPAYLALEPAADSALGAMALLIGVNAGPVITPWASLATLLWADQARRQGVRINWRIFILAGLVLAPLGVGLGVLGVLVQQG